MPSPAAISVPISRQWALRLRRVTKKASVARIANHQW
jgi:hypothetical protein